MPKILIFSIAYHPFVGGAEIAVKEITDRNPDFEYYLITNKFDSSWLDEEKIGNINVRRVGSGAKLDKYLYPFRAFRYAFRLHKVVKFDFVWSIMAFYAGVTALFFKYFTKTPYLLTLQSGDSDEFIRKRTWWWGFYYKQVYRQAKITQAISQYLAKRSRKAGNRGEIILVPNGVDLDLFKENLSPEEKLSLKKSLNIADGDFVLISVSRLVLKNAIDDVIKALNFLLYKSGLKIKLILIGSGPDEKVLTNLALHQGVEDNIIFLGHKDYAELPKYLQLADVFVRPSLSEGLGNAFLESMAVGTPVIGTEVGGIPDFLVNAETGLFCEVRNPSSIAQAVEKYHQDHELYQKIKTKGKNLVQAKYSWDLIADKMKQVFTKMMQ